MLDFENIGEKFAETVRTEQWESLQEKFNNANDIYVLGHGGNLAIADHAAVDITRLSNGTKNAMCPGSAIVATSLINDTDFDQWMVSWVSHRTMHKTKSQMNKSLVLGISSSGRSKDINKALQWANDNGMQIALITSNEITEKIPNLTQVVLGANYYHTAEVLTLLLTYELTHGSGKVCPPINKNSPDDLKSLNWKGDKIRKHSYPDEEVNVAIDFDGVIHKCSKGYHDGTIYDNPVDGVAAALEQITSSGYNIIVFTCKARADRGLVNGKTGTELVWEWLRENNLDKYVNKVTAEKPRACVYIDDKSVKFEEWGGCLEQLKKKNILK